MKVFPDQDQTDFQTGERQIQFKFQGVHWPENFLLVIMRGMKASANTYVTAMQWYKVSFDKEVMEVVSMAESD